MSPAGRRLIACTVALSATSATGFAQSTGRVDDATLVRRMDAYVAPLVTHTYPLDDAATAFETALHKSSGAIKVTVLP